MKLLRNILLSTLAIPLFIACGTVTDDSVGTDQLQLQAAGTAWVDDVTVPSGVDATVTATDCTNSPGPFITLDGVLGLGEFSVELVFRNNLKGTHEYVEEASVSLSVLGGTDTIVLPKQPVLGGVGGNPWVFVQLVDSDGVALTGEQLLGRCVQGLSPVDLDFGAPGLTDAWLTDLSCSNNPGPFINVDGSLTMKGVSARFIFRNNLQGTHEADVEVELTLMQDGTSFSFPKQPPLGGVGGNPHIWVRYTDGDGGVLGSETYLGRCKQLSKDL